MKPSPNNGAFNPEADLFTIVTILFKRRRMILRNLAAAAIFFLLLGLIWPASYLARTTLLPPSAQQNEALMSVLNNAPLLQLALPVTPSTSELFLEILASRSVGAAVLHTPVRVDSSYKILSSHWNLKSEEKALKRLYDRTSLSASEQGLIEIAVEMDSPEWAAAIANAFVAALDSINREKSISAARNSRLYIEGQLALTEQNLRTLADSLARFQTRYGAVGLEDQMRTMLERVGELKGNLIAKQIELDLMKRSMKPGNPALSQMRDEIAALENQYRQLQYGGQKREGKAPEYLIPFAEMPELARRLAELLRELKVQETVWQLLNQQYYQAKIQEARDTPTVQVLDPALPPEFRSKPKRVLMLLIGVSAVLMLSVLYALASHYFVGFRTNATEWQKWQKLFRDGTTSEEWVKQEPGTH